MEEYANEFTTWIIRYRAYSFSNISRNISSINFYYVCDHHWDWKNWTRIFFLNILIFRFQYYYVDQQNKNFHHNENWNDSFLLSSQLFFPGYLLCTLAFLVIPSGYALGCCQKRREIGLALDEVRLDWFL